MIPRISFLVLTAILVNSVHSQTVQKCCGTSNSTFLLGNLTTASHSQCIYTPGDLANEQNGGLFRLYYRYGTTGQELGNTLSNFMVRLVQTTATSFAGGNTFFIGLDTVLTRASYSIPPGVTGDWFAIDLDSVFAYDPLLTLIVDISFTGSTTTNFGTRSSTMAGRKLYWSNTTSPTGESVVSSWQDIGFDIIGNTAIVEGRIPDLQLMPNPARDRTQLFLREPITQDGALQVFDGAGRMVHEELLPKGSTQATLDVTGFPVGPYAVRITSPGVLPTTERLLVTR